MVLLLVVSCVDVRNGEAAIQKSAGSETAPREN